MKVLALWKRFHPSAREPEDLLNRGLSPALMTVCFHANAAEGTSPSAASRRLDEPPELGAVYAWIAAHDVQYPLGATGPANSWHPPHGEPPDGRV